MQWTTHPDDRSDPCKARSVLKLVPPEGAKGAQISLTFSGNEEGWVFNLGDLPHNNGYGKCVKYKNYQLYVKIDKNEYLSTNLYFMPL